MSLSDPIADMLNRIRNAGQARREIAEVPHSRVKGEIARILKREGYVADFVTEGQAGRKVIRIYLKYTPDRAPLIRGLRRISRPGLRRYAASTDLPRVMGGMGMAIVSTSQGLLTDREARANRLGGEVLFQVW